MYKKIILLIIIGFHLKIYAQKLPEINGLGNSKSDSVTFDYYIKMTDKYLKKNVDSANYYLLKAEPLEKKLSNNKQKALYFYKKGVYYSRIRNFYQSNICLKKAADIANKIAYDGLYKKVIWYQIHNIELSGNYVTALKEFLNFDRQLDEKDLELKINNQKEIVTCYLLLGKIDKADYYLNNLLHLCRNAKDSLTYYNEKIYFNSIAKKFDPKIVDIAIELAVKTNSIEELMTILTNTSDYYIYHNQIEKGIKMVNKLLEISKKNKYEIWEGLGYLNLAEAYMLKKEYKKALIYFKKSDFVLDKDILIKETSYLKRSECYVKMGDYKNAYKYYVESSKISEKIRGQSQQKMIADLETQYQLADKQSEITKREIKNKVQALKMDLIERQKYLYLTLFLISFSLAVFAWLNFRKSQLLGVVLLRKSKNLEEVNSSKDKLFRILSHDLKEPINELVNLLLLFENKDISNYQMQLLIEKLNRKLHALQMMFDNLLNWSIEQFKGNDLAKTQINVQTIIERIIEQTSSQVLNKNIYIKTDLINVRIEANETQIEIVLRNLINNAIKFTKYGGSIHISTKKLRNKVYIIIKDNGVGIPTDKLNEIFNFPKSSTGTNGEIGTGLGLRICKELTENNNGTISLENSQEGVLVTVMFPES